MKSLRLTFFNIKKHIWSFLIMVLLATVSMTLLGAGISNMGKTDVIFDRLVEGNDGIRNLIGIRSESYLDQYEDLLKEDDRVSRVVKIEALHTITGKITVPLISDMEIGMILVNEENEAKIENSKRETTLTDEEIEALEHPIWMPFYAKDTLGLRPGNSITLTIAGKKQSFQVAGFYDTVFFSNATNGIKMIVSDEDYKTLRFGSTEVIFLGFDEKETKTAIQAQDIIEDFLTEGNDLSDGMLTGSIEYSNTYYFEQAICSSYGKVIMILIIVMSIILTVAISFLIWHRINSDMEEQIKNIGVLMALGYRSKDISRVYVFEYALVGVIGAIFGFLGSMVLSPIFFYLFQLLSGHHGTAPTQYGLQLVTSMILVLILVFIAWIKAVRVRKFPPVVALRNGTGDHLFKKNHFSLEKTGKSVNFRMAMKLLSGKVGQSVGIFLCITAASAAFMTGILYRDMMDKNTILKTAGMELADVKVELNSYVDAGEMKEDLLADSRVRKVLLTTPMITAVEMGEEKSTVLGQIYENFEDTENIVVVEGRAAIHDNEFMINSVMATMKNIKIGDEILLGCGRIQQKYIVTGFVTSTPNGGQNIYMTWDGYHRADPASRLNCLDIYLNEGVDRKEFRQEIEQKYGRSLTDLKQAVEEARTPEEKIRAKAEEKMAVLIAEYGVSGVDYSITIGDQVISGNSDEYRIKDTNSLLDLVEQQMLPQLLAINLGVFLFGFLDLTITAVLLIMVVSSAIKKLQKELGIMKALGYTSRDLAVQVGFSVMPPTVLAIVSGAVIARILINLLGSFYGEIHVNSFHLILSGVIIAIFCMLISLIGILRIKKISPYELMSE